MNDVQVVRETCAKLHVHFLRKRERCASNAGLITFYVVRFLRIIRTAITLVVMRIFRRGNKCRIGNVEENTFIERMKVLMQLEMQYLILFRYRATFSQFV